MYLPNCQANLVIALFTLSLLFCKFINTTAYHLGRQKPSPPSTKELHDVTLSFSFPVSQLTPLALSLFRLDRSFTSSHHKLCWPLLIFLNFLILLLNFNSFCFRHLSLYCRCFICFSVFSISVSFSLDVPFFFLSQFLFSSFLCLSTSFLLLYLYLELFNTKS